MRQLAQLVVLLALALATIASPGIAGEPLRLATWRIPEPGHEVGRPLAVAGGDISPVRQAADFDPLQQQAARLDADVIALQSVESPQAVRRVFPAGDYHLVFSRQLLTRTSEAERRFEHARYRTTYTAIVVRRSSQIRVQRVEQLGELAYRSEEDEDGDLSAGLAVHLFAHGRHLWLLSVDLAELCRGLPVGASCRTDAYRIDVLASWIGERMAGDIPFIIAGNLVEAAQSSDADVITALETSAKAAASPGTDQAAEPQPEGPPPLIGLGNIDERTKLARERRGRMAEDERRDDSIATLLLDAFLDVVFGIDRRHPPEPPPTEWPDHTESAETKAQTESDSEPRVVSREPTVEPAGASAGGARVVIDPIKNAEQAPPEGRLSAVDLPLDKSTAGVGGPLLRIPDGTQPHPCTTSGPVDPATGAAYILIDPRLGGPNAVVARGALPGAAREARRTDGCPVYVDLDLNAAG